MKVRFQPDDQSHYGSTRYVYKRKALQKGEKKKKKRDEIPTIWG